jgi:hypothetical protein
MSLGIRIKGASLPGSPYRASIKREICHFHSLLLHIFSSPQERSPPSRSPGRVPRARYALLPGTSFTYLSYALVKEPSLQVPPAGPLWRELPIYRACFYISVKVPKEQGLLLIIKSYLAGKGAPPCFPWQAPVERVACFQGLLLRITRTLQWRSSPISYLSQSSQ